MTSSIDNLSTPPRPRRCAGWRQVALFTGALLGGSLAGAGGISYAAMISGSFDWHHGHRLETIQRHVRAALDAVGATSIQEDKIHDIITAGFMPLEGEHGDRDGFRKQMIELLRAPTIDRAAIEKLRADGVAKFEARSKAITGMILDSADQLTPEQRAALADKAEAMMAHGHEGWHRWGGSRDHGPGSGMEEGHGHGPDDDQGSNRDGRPDSGHPG